MTQATQATSALKPGTSAPDFSLPNPENERISLSQFRGKPVILAFYPADWSGTCGNQLALYNEVLPEFQGHDAVLLGISVDGRWSHKAYTDDNHRYGVDPSPKSPTSRRSRSAVSA